MGDFSNSDETRLDPALAALNAGTRVGSGRITLLRLLGRGGMGVVWLARDEQLREGVALKFLPPEIRHDASALDDLRRETARSRKLTHPHIIRIHDFYKSADEAFISMEYVDGPNLSELRLQQRDRVLKWDFLEPLIAELLDALHYAHGEHIIHRDLKPANMMLDGRGRLKLADFGIAAIVTDTVSRLSLGRHGQSGTACYMSPQQLNGQMPQVADDIYSLGATLYELLASRAPFFTGDIAHQVRSFAAQPIEKRLAQLNINNAVPPAVSAMIMGCLAKEPDQRPQSARAIAEQIGLRSLMGAPRSTAQPTSRSVDPAPPSPRTASPKNSVPSMATAADAPMYPQARPIRTAAPEAPVSEVTPSASKPNQVEVQKPDAAAAIRPATETQPQAQANEAPDRTRRQSILAAAALFVIVATLAGIWWSRQRTPNDTIQTAQPSAPPAPEFVSIFNGHDFAGWDGDPQVWSVKNGIITAINGTSKERRPVALFWRGGTVDDFELRLSFRLKNGNSGVYYRAKQLLGYEVGGYQYEITGNQTGTLLESGPDRMRRQPSKWGAVTRAEVIKGREKLTVESTNAIQNAFRSRQWNDAVIIVRSNHIIHQLNGTTVIETTDVYDQRPRSGTIALEVYGTNATTVEFRDIRLKRLRP